MPSSFVRSRNVAQLLGKGWTAEEFREILEIEHSTAHGYLTRLVEAGLLRRRSGARPNPAGTGRPLTEFDFLLPRERDDYAPDRVPEHTPPPEAMAVRKFSRGATVTGTGKKGRVKTGSKEKTKLIRAAERQGFTVTASKRGQRIHAVSPDGEKVWLGHSTPSATGVKKDRKRLANAGFRAA
jgi:hypothetical protein